MKDYTEDEIKKAIWNYEKVLKGDEFYWTHKWSLKDFLKRGLEKFLDEADPLHNFLKDKTKQQYKNLTSQRGKYDHLNETDTEL